ncbi:hypothetical protein J6590_039982 [Homalodisca vitripennis]|nr:hypothetical protein J6590_039982 [Homalodisca vitripennis]
MLSTPVDAWQETAGRDVGQVLVYAQNSPPIAPTPQPCAGRAVPPVAPPPVTTSPPLPSSPTPYLTLLGPASSPSSPSKSAPLTVPHNTFAEVVAGTSKPNSNYQLANVYCRKSFKGGGVAIFLKNELSFTPLTLFKPTDKHCEHTGVSQRKRGIVFFFLSKFDQILTGVANKSRGFIVMGDFNIDVLDVDSPMTRRLADFLRSFDLNWSVNSPSTRVTSNSATSIDKLPPHIDIAGLQQNL